MSYNHTGVLVSGFFASATVKPLVSLAGAPVFKPNFSKPAIIPCGGGTIVKRKTSNGAVKLVCVKPTLPIDFQMGAGGCPSDTSMYKNVDGTIHCFRAPSPGGVGAPSPHRRPSFIERCLTPTSPTDTARGIMGLGSLGAPPTETTPVAADTPSTGYTVFTAAWSALSLIGTGAGAYHGYKRNNGSIGWAIGWALLGSMFPVFTLPISYAQGFGKPIGRSANPRKLRSVSGDWRDNLSDAAINGAILHWGEKPRNTRRMPSGLYNVIAVSKSSGNVTEMTSKPVGYEEALVLMSKITPHPSRRIDIEQVEEN